jgi:hypothetical protein
MPMDSQPSFSPSRKWSIGFNVCIILLSVLAMVVMVNYIAREHFGRWHWSSGAGHELSTRTRSLLRSITEPVKVTLYYDRKDPFYTTIVDLLNQYAAANHKISVKTVDYVREPGAAQNVKTDYKLVLNTEKNVIIFDCQGRVIRMDGDALTHYIMEQLPSEKELEFRRKPTAFEGETRFSAALLAVTSPTPLTAYFVQGHREHPLEGGELGYQKFASILHENCIGVRPFSLLGTNALDCNLLIIAGPGAGGSSEAFFDSELEKIDKYLTQGGRLLVLFNSGSINKQTGREKTGLDKLLAKWGVEVGAEVIQDLDHKMTSVYDMLESDFNQKHPLVNSLLGSPGLYLVRPRVIGKTKSSGQSADVPRVEELAFTGPRSTVGSSTKPQSFPYIVAVERGAIQGVITERGATRLVVVGDSFFLCDAVIDSAANRDFAGCAVDWLVNRAQLLEGIGPRPIKTYKVVMSNAQWQKTQWMLLAGLPGGVLTFGGLVWLRRRK